ncbi:MAG TPA: hypothetical protein VH186_18685 [Chloroflexia bacterium]|nr:hypothetical protein [Chloroflexia bacterium]
MPVDVLTPENNVLGNLMAAAIFENSRQAEIAVSALQQAGFDLRQVSFMQRKGEVLAELEKPGPVSELVPVDEQPLAENPAVGAISGMAIGGATGWLVGLALVTIPGLGPFLAAGTMATLLGSAAVGAAAGGIGGALLLWGAPEDMAHHYSSQLVGRRCMLAVEADTTARQNQAADLLVRTGGKDVRTFTRQVGEANSLT